MTVRGGELCDPVLHAARADRDLHVSGPFTADILRVAGSGACRLVLQRPEGSAPACFAWAREAFAGHLRAWADTGLGPAETAAFRRCRTREREISYLLGRHVARHAVALYLKDQAHVPFEIASGVFNQPIVRGPVTEPPGITISHTGDLAVAIAHDAGHKMGVDIEHSRGKAGLGSVLTDREARLAEAMPFDEDVRATAIWTMKESLSKALRCGLTVPLSLLEVGSVVVESDGSVRSDFSNFGQYKCQTWICDPHVLSIALPLKTEVMVEESQVR
jgi:4'-phosphopantetheinyl transferase